MIANEFRWLDSAHFRWHQTQKRIKLDGIRISNEDLMKSLQEVQYTRNWVNVGACLIPSTHRVSKIAGSANHGSGGCHIRVETAGTTRSRPGSGPRLAHGTATEVPTAAGSFAEERGRWTLFRLHLHVVHPVRWVLSVELVHLQRMFLYKGKGAGKLDQNSRIGRMEQNRVREKFQTRFVVLIGSRNS